MDDSPRILLRTKELARQLKIKPGTLEKARSTGKGAFATLPYLRADRVVLYDWQTVEGWLARRQCGVKVK